MITFSMRQFFLKKFEEDSTNLLLDDAPYFSKKAVVDYLCQLNEHSIEEYVLYLKENPIADEISAKDITQLSSIEDCSINMCKMMISNSNQGLTLIEIASNLHADDNYKDNAVALTKYGENQVKTACQLGLATCRKGLWYLTAVGSVFLTVSDEIQNKYLAINLLRDPFYSRVILSLCEQDTYPKDFMGILSESTQVRRSSSCNRVLSFFIKQCELESFPIHNLISK